MSVMILPQTTTKIRLQIVRRRNRYFCNMWLDGQEEVFGNLLTVEEAQAHFDLYKQHSIIGSRGVCFEPDLPAQEPPTEFSWEAEWRVDGEGKVVN
jgi:hypothetical protein